MADKKSRPQPATIDAAREAMHRQMLSSVSHDLKTPLATMIGSLEIYCRMEDKLAADKKRTLVTSALNEAYRLDAFITNILDMAKFESGMVTPRFEKTDSAQLIADCLLRLGPKRDRGKITVTPHGATQVNTDAMLLMRAITQLLDNALKYGGDSPDITIEHGVKNGKFVLSVRDKGPGIPEAMMEKIFSKYTRLHKVDQQNAGTGLGLAISRHITHSLQGTVTVENHPEGGAVFTLTLPL